MVKMALSSSVSKSSNDSKSSRDSNKSANAALVGAKTVKGPSPLKVPTKSVPSELSAVISAETREDNASSPCATVTMLLSVLDSIISSFSFSQDHAKKTIASNASKFLIDTTSFIRCAFR